MGHQPNLNSPIPFLRYKWELDNTLRDCTPLAMLMENEPTCTRSPIHPNGWVITGYIIGATSMRQVRRALSRVATDIDLEKYRRTIFHCRVVLHAADETLIPDQIKHHARRHRMQELATRLMATDGHLPALGSRLEPLPLLWRRRPTPRMFIECTHAMSPFHGLIVSKNTILTPVMHSPPETARSSALLRFPDIPAKPVKKED